MNVEEKLLNAVYEGVVYFTDFGYDDALIGVSWDNKATYDYEKMVEWLVEKEDFTDEQAMEWIDFNVIRALPYIGDDAPVVMMPFE